MSSVGFYSHDHDRCISDALAQVEARCETDGLKFTPVRRRVLEILVEKHHALGAYEILEVLKAEGLGSQPPVAYRALDFLVSNGFAHRIERLNAYTACAHLSEAHAPAFLICRSCKLVAEAPTEISTGALGEAARENGFKIERVVVEAEGLCPNCRETPA